MATGTSRSPRFVMFGKHKVMHHGAYVALVVGLLLLSGCRLGAEVAVDVDADGGGRVTLTLVTDGEIAAQAAEADLALFDDVAGVAGEAERWSAELADTEEGGRWLELTGRARDAEALAGLLDDLAEGLAGPELRPLEDVTVEVDEEAGQLTVSGVASTALGEAVADLGVDRDEAVAELDDALRYTVVVRMPGEVLEHDDGTLEADERSVRWEVPAGEEVAFAVTGEQPTELPLALLAALAAVAGLAALALAWRLRRS